MRTAIVGQQQVQALLAQPCTDLLRLVKPVKRNHLMAAPGIAIALIQVQNTRFRIQGQHPARHQRHAGGGFGDAAERLHHVYGMAL